MSDNDIETIMFCIQVFALVALPWIYLGQIKRMTRGA